METLNKTWNWEPPLNTIANILGKLISQKNNIEWMIFSFFYWQGRWEEKSVAGSESKSLET